MNPLKSLLDTDILSSIMRKNPSVIARAQNYLKVHSRFAFSIITRYEILRGLKAKGATTQLKNFDRFCEVNEIAPLNDAIVVSASDIYADLYKRGVLIGDADILIAATALSHGLVVVTNNEEHFRRITGLQIDNWLK